MSYLCKLCGVLYKKMPALLDPSGTLSNPQTYIYFTDRTQNEDLRSHW